jgi:peptide/nickel transport system ATP-binding protein
MTPVLDIRGYTLDYALRSGAVHALESIDLAIAKGEAVGLVGESGSGKTSLAWAIMRYLSANAIERAGKILLSGEDLRAKSARAIAVIRGRRISMVFQDPSTSLNPTLKLGEQVAEVLVRHRGLTKAQAWREGEAMLGHVGLQNPAAMMQRYPHEASGGEKQRVVIATAFACQPECIVFDEPTTALDVITARQILDLFAKLQAETSVASLYISHDLAVVSRIANRVAVIHRGRLVETDTPEAVFRHPREDYTRRLIAAVPRPDRRLAGPAPKETTSLIEARAVTVHYGRTSLVAQLLRRAPARVTGARDVSFTVRPREILGIVGESGSGKSTIARAFTGLAPFDGELRFGGRTVHGAGDMDRLYRRDVQIVFQHPDASLNPRQRVGEILSRPMILYGDDDAAARRRRIGELLEQVQLPPAFARRFPHQLSGGEKQRVAIARAFASRPRLVICDEITSSLDVSVQAAVIELLLALQRQHGTAYLFITHDLNLVRQIAHRIAVMYRGDLVELVTIEELAAGPRHPYTRALMDAIPAPAGAA